MKGHRSDISGLFVGKQGKSNPSIPTPERREIPVTEEMVHPPHRGVAARPLMVKPRERILIPHYNRLYGTLRTESDWRYCIDNYANGTITDIAGAQAIAQVSLHYVPNWRLEQWPGGTNLYYCIRAFGFAANAEIQGPLNVPVPATAGNVTLFTGAGTINSIVVTTTGATALNFQDGAGNIIATVPGGSAAGFTLLGPYGFSTSLVAQKSATTPVVTVNYTPNTSVGSLDVYYQDNLTGFIVPLGEYASDGSGNTNMDIIIPVAVSDPGLQANIGQLQFVATAGDITGTIDWQLAFSGVYLLPDIRDDEIYTRGGPQHETHSHRYD